MVFKAVEKRFFHKKYENLSVDDRQRLKQSFLDEQYYICGYCCGKATIATTHNEHIVPQSFSKIHDSLNYNNMIASCNGFSPDRDTCGHKKDRYYDRGAFVSPLDQDCEQNFKYYINGEIVGKNEKAKYTIDLLNLNSGALKNARKGVLKQSLTYDREMASAIYSEPDNGKLYPLCNVVKYFLNTHPDHFAHDDEK